MVVDCWTASNANNVTRSTIETSLHLPQAPFKSLIFSQCVKLVMRLNMRISMHLLRI